MTVRTDNGYITFFRASVILLLRQVLGSPRLFSELFHPLITTSFYEKFSHYFSHVGTGENFSTSHDSFFVALFHLSLSHKSLE